MKSNSHLRFSIRLKVIALVGMIIFILNVFYTIHSYREQLQEVYLGLDEKLAAAAAATVQILGPNYHDVATGEGTIEPGAYLAYKRRLSDYSNPLGVRYIYTVVERENKIFFTSSSSTMEEWAEKGPERMHEFYDDDFYDEWEDAPPLVSEVMQKWETRILEEYTDEYGTHRSIFVPLVTKNGNRYVVGADISIDYINDRLRKNVRRSVIGGIGFFVVFVTVASFLLGRLTSPLRKLVEKIEGFVSSGFTPLPQADRDELRRLAKRSKDEVSELSHAFVNLESMLQEHIQKLESETANRERLESELNIAREIQMGLLPKIFPPFPQSPDLDLEAFLESARAVGGDLYDFFFIDEDTFFFAVGDVSDKGVPAALFMAVTKSLLKTIAEEERQPERILHRLNNILCEENEQGLFVTFFCAIVKLSTSEMTFSDGGHNPPLICRQKTGVEWLPKPEGGVALGVFPDIDYTAQTTQLNPGDRVVFYTDGLTEAYNPEKELYGEDRLLECLRSIEPSVSNKEAVERILADLEAFRRGAEPSDDLTMICLQLKDRSGKSDSTTVSEHKLKADLKEMDRLAEILDQWAEEADIDPSLKATFNICLDEVITNVISYGFDDSKEDTEILLRLAIDGDFLEATVIDEGLQFNPLERAAPDTSLDLDEREIGGLGIHLVKEMMDEVDYIFEDGKNHLRMRKQVASE
jgi:sigma-B regulation protein RsbU (phosphoserine phosphatase)